MGPLYKPVSMRPQEGDHRQLRGAHHGGHLHRGPRARGDAEWGLAVCDLPDGSRAYAKILEPDLLVHAEERELVGATATLVPATTTPTS